MDRKTFYYDQKVTEGEMNEAFDDVANAEKNTNIELGLYGINTGLEIQAQSPTPSTSVDILPGSARIKETGQRVNLANLTTLPVDQDEFGQPTYSDLLAGEGRWCSIFCCEKWEDSDPRTDGYGMPLYYKHKESIEFFVHRESKGQATDKDTLPRPAYVPNALKLADIWFENGAEEIVSSDIDYNLRQDFFRAFIGALQISSGNIYNALRLIASFTYDLSNPDLPTGANDGAHKIGLGGTATENEFKWRFGRYLNATEDNVHSAIAKIISDLGSNKSQGMSGANLISTDDDSTGHWKDGEVIGGWSIGANDTVQYALSGIVQDLASNHGSDLIGSQALSSTYYGSTLNVVASSIYDQLQSLIQLINTRVNVDGDNRINGDIAPQTDNSFNLGALNYRWNRVFTEGVSNPTGRLLLGGASVDFTNVLGFPYMRVDSEGLYPVSTADKIGTDTDPISMVHAKYTLGGIKFDQPKNIVKMLSIADLGFDGQDFSWNSNISPAYIINTSYTRSLIVPLSFLKTSDRLVSIDLDIDPNTTSIGAIRGWVKRRSFGGIIETRGDAGSSTGSSRQTISFNIGEDIESDYSYFVVIQFRLTNGNRLYGVRVNYQINYAFR